MATKVDGCELKLTRIKAKILQKELAKAIGLPAPTLCMIENGDREARPDEIKRIKKALKERGVEWPKAIEVQ